MTFPLITYSPHWTVLSRIGVQRTIPKDGQQEEGCHPQGVVMRSERKPGAPLSLLHHQKGMCLISYLGAKLNCHFSSSFYYLRRGTRRTVNKIPASRDTANPAPEMSTRTGAHVDVAQTHLPHQELDEVSVTNSEVESAMNHRHLKEALRTPALTEP